MSEQAILWGSFSVFVLGMLALDLGVFHRKSHEVSIKEALTWTAVWLGLAMLFNLFVFYYFDKETALEFFTAYLVEKSLSIDNIFVMIMIFSAAFGLPGFGVDHVLAMTSRHFTKDEVYVALYNIFNDMNVVRFIMQPGTVA